MEFETTGLLDTFPREDFLQNIYEEAQLHLDSLMKDSTQSEAQDRLEELNDIIKNRNVNDAGSLSESDRTKAFIDILTFLEKFQSAKPFHDILEKDPADTAAGQELEKINSFLKDFNQKHDYPESWVLFKPAQGGASTANNTKTWQPGLIRKLELILGC